MWNSWCQWHILYIDQLLVIRHSGHGHGHDGCWSWWCCSWRDVSGLSWWYWSQVMLLLLVGHRGVAHGSWVCWLQCSIWPVAWSPGATRTFPGRLKLRYYSPKACISGRLPSMPVEYQFCAVESSVELLCWRHKICLPHQLLPSDAYLPPIILSV